MLDKFEEIECKALADNVFQLLDDEWMLITAGKFESFNTMTASWGSFGILWHKPIATIFVRPHRYTLQFLEKESHFSLSFFGDQYKNELNFCGQNTGKNVDKVAETGLLPFELPSGVVAFEQARMVLDCKKLYVADLKGDHFLEKDIIHREYPGKDYHRMYIAEILHCYVAEK